MVKKNSESSFILQKNNLKTKNMPNNKLKTQAETKTRTRLITGIVIAVMAAIGIGTAIWYFAANVQPRIVYSENFDDDTGLLPKEDVKIDDGKAIFKTDIETFTKSLDDINYLCPSELNDLALSIQIDESKVDGIRVKKLENNNIELDTSLMKSENQSTLTEIVKVRINQQDAKDVDLSQYFGDNVDWTDIIRWEVDDPTIPWSANGPSVLMVLSDGTIFPVWLGQAKIRASICNNASNQLTINISNFGNDYEESFNDITTAGIGVNSPFFAHKYTNGILKSRELSDVWGAFDLEGRRVTGIVNGEIALSLYDSDFNPNGGSFIADNDLNLFFSFDDGQTWKKTALFRAEGNNFRFSMNDLPPDSNNLRWTLMYQYTGDELAEDDVGIEPLQNNYRIGFPPDDVIGWLDIPRVDPETSLRQNKKVLFVNKEQGVNISDISQNPGMDKSTEHCLEVNEQPIDLINLKSKNSCISNFQSTVVLSSGAGVVQTQNFGLDVVTLPGSLVLDYINFDINVSGAELDEEPGPGEVVPPADDEPLDPIDENANSDVLMNVVLNAEPTSGASPLEVNFSAEYEGGTPPFLFHWDFDSTFEAFPDHLIAENEESNIAFTYDRTGTYRPYLTIEQYETPGELGRAFGPEINVGGFKITANPLTGEPPLNVHFDVDTSAYGANKDLSQTTFEWDFGDDSEKSNIKNPQHTYSNAGQYEVNLNIQDPDFTGTISTEIAVLENEASADENKPREFADENETDLLVSPEINYRGYDRAIIKWKVNKDEFKNQDLSFKDGTNISLDQDGNPLGGILQDETVHYNENEDYYYAVLRNLEGGKKTDKNDNGYINGSKPYYFQISLGNQASNVQNFATLNRFQTILYYYNLVYGDTFDLSKYTQVDDSLRGGGPAFYYDPPGEEPLSLKGVQFALLNDKKFQEFDKRLQATADKDGIDQAVIEIYSRVLNRVYDNNLNKKYDDKGKEYWTKQIERTDDDKIDVLGAKFAISVSPEYEEQFTSELSVEQQPEAEAIMAYQIVLKRAGEQKGVDNLEKLGSPKEMREELATSGEYNERLKVIEEKRGRKAAIEELYETIYARAPDVIGVKYWDETGKPIQEIKAEFLNSQEFVNVAS